MIVSFSVSNFLSFASEQTISMVASKRLAGAHDNHAVPIPDSDEKVLRAAVIYGANGAGKSNLFKALQFVKSAALEARPRSSGTGRRAFRFGELDKEPSGFDLQFIAEGKLYRYGLKVDDQRVIEEWLVRVNRGREKVIYERVTDEDGNVTVDAKGLRKYENVQALATVGGPPNQSFLATVHAMLPFKAGDDLHVVMSWFREVELVPPDGDLRLDPQSCHSLKFGSDFLKASGTGVEKLGVVRRELPPAQAQELQAHLLNVPAAQCLVTTDRGWFLVERERGYELKLQAQHVGSSGEPIALDLSEESDGTQRLVNLIPALERSSWPSVYFVDEIDRSLHPNLVWMFLDRFLAIAHTESQIILTTHESNLLDLDLLRRDEIWFAEKDRNLATHLYSLADFKVRKDLEIRKHYLQGRFGAVPFLGNLDRLVEPQAGSE